MKRIVCLLAGLAMVACGTGMEGKQEETKVPQTNEIAQGITSDTTWNQGDTYVLKTHIFVSNGATLTIQPGAIVKGEPGSSLVVTREGKLNAVGTRELPIVFTSSQEVGSRKPGDWGGLVLLGKAPINVQGGENSIEGFATTDDSTKYGSTTPDADHDCGKLKYARIEFAGFELVKDNELNGLTLAGCGRKTEVDYVQVHKGADDGVEMFGGTADLRHIVVTQPDDDGFDTDFGYSGRVQFLIIQQNADVGNAAFEWDNNNNNKNATPRTAPELWNVTLVGTTREAGGAKNSIGMHLRRGTAGKINNVIVTNFVDGAIDIDSTESAAQFNEGNLFVRNSFFWNNKGRSDVLMTAEKSDNDGGLDEALELLKPETGNSLTDPMLTDALNLLSPNFMPKAGSPALTGPAPTGEFFDTSATFVGAMGVTDWTAGWTAYPAN